MYEVAYLTLINTLEKIEEEKTDINSKLLPFIMLQAWSMIDSANRLRNLLNHMPGVKKKNSKYYSLIKELSPIENLRNTIQHLDGEINSRAKDLDAIPVWGSLSWGKIISNDPFEADIYLIVPGSIESQSNIPINNIAGKAFYNNIDNIELTAYGITISLSETYRNIEKITKLLETGLLKNFKDKPELVERHGTDLIIKLRISLENQQK
jgi:hypothetical protein